MGSKPEIARETRDELLTSQSAGKDAGAPPAGMQALQPQALRPQGIPREIPIADIFITKNNVRTEFDTPADAELVESIRQNGVLERLLVRDNSKWASARTSPGRSAGYDLMAGERRLRAAIKVGLKTVPCEVFDVDDEKAYEIMLIENLQSKDLHELDYAKGLQIMMKRYGYNVAQTAERIQKGETFVREMLSFADLPESAEAAFRKGDISKSHAVLISTIPDEKKRNEFAKCVLEGRRGRDWGKGEEPLSVRQAKDLKEREYMKDLGKAPFPLDRQIDPDWPYSCLTCTHYNGNTPETRQGKRPNICLNPTHYAVMVDLWNASQLEALEAKDNERITVLKPGDGKKLFNDNGYLITSDYIDLSREVYDYKTSRNRNWGAVVNQAHKPIIVTVDREGKIRKLSKRSDAEAAAKEVGIQQHYSSTSRSSPEKSKEQAAARLRQRIKREAAMRAIASTEALRQFWNSLTFSRRQELALKSLAQLAIKDADYDGQKFLAQSLGLELAKRKYGGPVGKPALQKYAANLKGAGLFAFVVQCLTVKGMHSWAVYTYSEAGVKERHLLRQCGVEVKTIIQRVAAEKRAKKKIPKLKAKPAKVKALAKPKALRKAA